MTRIQTLIMSAAAVTGAAVLTACGSSSGSAGAASAPSSPAAANSPAGTAAIATAPVGKLGTIVVNGQRMTLYRFDADSNNPPASNCTGACAINWPPVPAGSGTPQAQGVAASLLGTLTRPDGSKQLTLVGWPLYTFAGDHAAGDANGQGINAFGAPWWALTPTGAKVTSTAAASSGSAGGGYGYGH